MTPCLLAIDLITLSSRRIGWQSSLNISGLFGAPIGENAEQTMPKGWNTAANVLVGLKKDIKDNRTVNHKRITDALTSLQTLIGNLRHKYKLTLLEGVLRSGKTAQNLNCEQRNKRPGSYFSRKMAFRGSYFTGSLLLSMVQIRTRNSCVMSLETKPLQYGTTTLRS